MVIWIPPKRSLKDQVSLYYTGYPELVQFRSSLLFLKVNKGIQLGTL